MTGAASLRLNERKIVPMALVLQAILFAAGVAAFLLSQNGWLLGFFSAGLLVSGYAAVLHYRRSIQPEENWVDIGKNLSLGPIAALTKAISEVSQGNFSVRLKPGAERTAAEPGAQLSEFASVLRDVATGIEKATFEFNELTDVPCRRLCYVGTDSFLEGRLSGETLARAIGGRGQVAISTAFMNYPSLELRRKGFQSLIGDKYPEIQIVETVETLEKAEAAYDSTLNLLKRHPRLAGLYVTEAPTPSHAAKAVCDSKKAHKIKIVSHDLTNETMEYVRTGVITATINQDPFAQGFNPAIHLFNHITAGWQPVIPRLLIRMETVDRMNWHRFWHPEMGLIRSEEDKTKLALPADVMPSKPLRFVALGREDNAFWTTIRAGVISAGEALKARNVTVDWRVPAVARENLDYSAAVYGAAVEECVREAVDGIMLFCGDSALVSTINRAVQAGIPVITFNTEPFNLRSLLYTVTGQTRKLMEMSRSLASSAAEVSAATSQISSTIEHITTGSVTQNEHFQSTEKALESLLTNINRINWEATRSAEAADRTVTAIRASNEAMDRSLTSIRGIENSSAVTSKRVQELSAHSERIDAVVHLIEDITSKVNVLSLNATIEATRAGEAGRGFMVVSNEVRGLAKSTAAATEEIGGLVEEIKTGIRDVQKAMLLESEIMQASTSVTDEAKGTLGTILSVLGENRERMRTIASSITEMKDFSNRVNGDVKEMVQVSSKNTQSIREINVATEGLNTQFRDVASYARMLETISQGEQELLAKFVVSEGKN